LLGTRALLGTQGIAYLLFGSSIILYFVAGIFETERKDRERTTSRDTGTGSRRVMLVLTLVVLTGATAAMLVPAQTQGFGIVSAEFESDSPDVIRQGTTESYTYTVHNTGVIPVEVMLEPAGDRIDATPDQLSIESRSRANATVTITAPPETGRYQAYLEQHRYLRVLPKTVIESLYGIHPWVPIVAINTIIGVPFYVFGLLVLGKGRVRARKRNGRSWLP
jgi:signal peptidase